MSRVLRILLAEDNPGDVFLVREALSRHSLEHELIVAIDGDAAWKTIEAAEQRHEIFDIFMLDLNLPARSGLELIARIRSSSHDFAQVPIVVVTSSNSPQDRAAVSRAGGDHYFCKPSHLDAFMQLGSIVKEIATRTRRDSKGVAE